MREPPPHVSDAEVLLSVRTHWLPEVDHVEHLPVGFGAHHWRASGSGRSRLFVTFDSLLSRHTPASLEGAYAGAAALAASGLEFVLAPIPALSRDFTVPFADGAFSATPWHDGEVAGDGLLPDRSSALANAEALGRLHAASAPPTIPTWAPLVPPDFVADLDERLRTPWTEGPYGEPARVALTERLDAIDAWVTAYLRLAEVARTRPWVPTHGEPHGRNLLVADTTDPGNGTTWFVDWESLKLAPRERDLRTLVDSGHGDLAAPYWPMIELFDLEWRLDEVAQYAAWFATPHVGTESDREAFEGLLEELDRPEWTRP